MCYNIIILKGNDPERKGTRMKVEIKSFRYNRVSQSGRLYEVEFSAMLTEDGIFYLNEVEFSLGETLYQCKEALTRFLISAMSKYKLGVAEHKHPAVNRGHAVAHINKGGRYFDVDGKLYRFDKHICGSWSAPASDVARILLAIEEGNDYSSSWWEIPPIE